MNGTHSPKTWMAVFLARRSRAGLSVLISACTQAAMVIPAAILLTLTGLSMRTWAILVKALNEIHLLSFDCHFQHDFHDGRLHVEEYKSTFSNGSPRSGGGL